MKTITDYLGAQLKGELDRLWADGTLNEEKVESFRTLHERTPYHKKVFTKLFEEAEIAKFTPTELKEYEDSLKAYRDVKNSIDTALEKGREEGMAKGMEIGIAKGMEKEKLTTARRLLSMGLSEEQVATATELPLEEIQKMKEQA